MKWLGIDPGMDGAAVLYESRARVMRAFDDPRPAEPPAVYFRDFTERAPSRGKRWDHARLWRELEPLLEDATVVLEQGRGQPGASTSSLSIGVSFGLMLGMVAAAQAPIVIVQPNVWHRKLFGRTTGHPKERAASYIRERFPAFDATAGGRFRKPHSGAIDAFCLALYGELDRRLIA